MVPVLLSNTHREGKSFPNLHKLQQARTLLLVSAREPLFFKVHLSPIALPWSTTFSLRAGETEELSICEQKKR